MTYVIRRVQRLLSIFCLATAVIMLHVAYTLVNNHPFCSVVVFVSAVITAVTGFATWDYRDG